MARYRRPASPSQRTTERQPIPWAWLGLGLLVTIVGLAVASAALAAFLTRPPEDLAGAVEPTIIRLTAPPVPTATAGAANATPTFAPTSTPYATPDLSVAPETVTAGFYAVVTGTEGVGVTVRNGPSTSNLPVTVAGEGSIILVLEGPQAGGSYQWWRVRLPNGTEGWAAADFLAPSAAP